MKRPYSGIIYLGIVLLAVVLLGIRHDCRRPNQHVNQYWAVRSLIIWTFYGIGVYARNKLAVYDMSGHTTENLPEPISKVEIQIRRLGRVSLGGSQYNLGEDHYDAEGCRDYVLRASKEVAANPPS